jgi:Arc/MetJ family transcription regulator
MIDVHRPVHQAMPHLVQSEGESMRTTVTLDDDLLQRAQRITGLTQREVLRAGLLALIERESARRLARLGGTEPQVEDIPRTRSTPA